MHRALLALAFVTTGAAAGTVNATFAAVSGTGPAILTAHFQFWVCRTGCATAVNWSLSPPSVSSHQSRIAAPSL